MAQWMMEEVRPMRQPDMARPDHVAAAVQTDSGDVSPNFKGAEEDTGSAVWTTRHGRTYEGVRMVATTLAAALTKGLERTETALKGPVFSQTRYYNFADVTL